MAFAGMYEDAVDSDGAVDASQESPQDDGEDCDAESDDDEPFVRCGYPEQAVERLGLAPMGHRLLAEKVRLGHGLDSGESKVAFYANSTAMATSIRWEIV